MMIPTLYGTVLLAATGVVYQSKDQRHHSSTCSCSALVSTPFLSTPTTCFGRHQLCYTPEGGASGSDGCPARRQRPFIKSVWIQRIATSGGTSSRAARDQHRNRARVTLFSFKVRQVIQAHRKSWFMWSQAKVALAKKHPEIEKGPNTPANLPRATCM